SIQYTVRHYQFGFRTGAVAVGPQRAGCEAKRMQDRESCAIRVDFEYRAISSAAALGRSSIKRAACQQQTALGECSVAIAVKHTRKGREIEKIRESSSIRTDRKNVSGMESASTRSHSVEPATRQNQVCCGILPVTGVEIVQVGESDAVGVDGKYIS